MLRNVYLEGEMGEKFGTNFQVHAETVQDVLKCMEANHPSFKKYLIDCHEEDVGFIIDVADNNLEYAEECLMEVGEGDITITPAAMGSKSALGKILAAILIVVVTVWAVSTFGAGTTLFAKFAGLTGVAKFAAFMALGVATNLAMAGIMQMMAPDPSTDSDQEESYLFNGAASNVIEGDPVPVLYGQLRVPGQPISFEVSGVSSYSNTYATSRGGGSAGASVTSNSTVVGRA
tara:strand:- start:9577 stop:10272 length:696 start_codon:yes stop_codon:yes gene_type:complete